MSENLNDPAVDPAFEEAKKLGGDAGPKNGNGTGPTPATVAPHISGPHPMLTEGDERYDNVSLPAPTKSGAEILLKAQKEFILAQQGYIHDQRLSKMVSAQKKYIVALTNTIAGYMSPTEADGEIAGAQEIFITALSAVLERKGLI